ncbi:hypothetical protein HPT27_15615 [Permianibacter sp. IMCC34836]|uniref:hypothetical protein n=1 Tax=Permianibacter fluminis TaxID=2738515 RepID=UPI0015547382|nr:hypothetical protein [Permianibacter fluminis]NQD38449.1 hypothetical protein [Permianibacter fluminis]
MGPIEVVAAIITAAGGSAVIVAGLAAWLGKLWLDRAANLNKLLGDVDVDLRKRRIEVYGELWKLTAILPKWPRDQTVTYEQLQAFSQMLRGWYYERGGMYLSRSTHKQGYGPLQDQLQTLLSAGKSGKITDVDYDVVREKCSYLRSCLASDIESRREGLDPNS